VSGVQRATALLLAPPLLLACMEEIARPTSGNTDTPAPATIARDGGLADDGGGAPKIEIKEGEFAESGNSRDPFRSYALAFADEAKGKVRSQRQVLLDKYSVDELKLVGIVTRIHPAKAMLVDPTGRGHVVQRGQLVGRAELVQPSGPGGAAYEVNWRVDRVRDGDIVLIREDPQNPDVPTATRVVPLRPEATLVSSD
jgi:type IV pilus assembly protein PilP